MGMVIGHESIRAEIPALDLDLIWQEYKHDENFYIPENIMTGVLYLSAKFVLVGYTLATWTYPYTVVIAVLLAVLSIVSLNWILYPIVFVYVIYDEQKNKFRKIKK